MQGLRERKRQRTREAIVAAAVRLFAERGFDGARVEDIIEAAEVSRSTFFRYFARKEDLVFVNHQARIARFRRLLQAQEAAPEAGPFQAVRQALLQAVEAVVEEYRADPERLRLPRRLVAETPALAAAASRAGLDWEMAIAETLGRRFGEDPEGRLRAELLAGAVAGPVRVAIRAWEDSDYRIDPRPLAQQGLEMVGRGLAETQAP